MDKLDNISENEIRIIGTNQNLQQDEPPKRFVWYVMAVVSVFLIIGLAIFFCQSHIENKKAPNDSIKMMVNSSAKMSPKMIEPSYKEKPAFVEISDTIINDVSLHRYIPVNAKPKLVVGLIKDIPPYYILGAMAADFGDYDGEYKIAGAFVHQGKMLNHSKSKYSFCALLKDTIVIGNDLTTSYFEKAIEDKGDFFRQHALVHEGKVVNKVISRIGALRRSLCRLNDGRLCIIETDMSVSLDDFALALRKYDVKEAIALMGTGAAVRWADDEAGRRYISGADEFEFPNVVNYIVWEKTHSAKKKKDCFFNSYF